MSTFARGSGAGVNLGRPNETQVLCPLCDAVMAAYPPARVERIHGSLRVVSVTTRWVEDMCVIHFSKHHRRRYWLYRRLGWAWLLQVRVR